MSWPFRNWWGNWGRISAAPSRNSTPFWTVTPRDEAHKKPKMPLIASTYDPPLFFRNGHLSTIYAGILRRVDPPARTRERIALGDGDFLDLDWYGEKDPGRKLIVLLHGLEGDAGRPYITGSAKLLVEHGFHCCALNLRGCSGEPNRLFRAYHSGATEDLREVLLHILNTTDYDRIYLKGFSLGGNLVLKYLGEQPQLPKQIRAAVAVSVPCDLKDRKSTRLNSSHVK